MPVRPASPRKGPSAARRIPRLAPPRPLDPELFEVVEHRLGNGLTVRLLRNPGVPAVSLYVFYRVGSRNERLGRTGMAHLFEHMMFNGAARYGPKEFDRQLEGAGGHSNAYTSHDVTAYYEDFASEGLELALDLESDRMQSLAITPEMLASEREVVKEERRFSVENEPMGVLDEQLSALAFQAHPYRWPIIGWMQDIESITREDCLEFFRTYYAPNNATLWVVGDFDPDRALPMVERWFGPIKSGPSAPPMVRTEPPQRGERRAEVRFPSHTAALAVAYKAPEGASPEAPVLDVLQYALSAGEGGRLVKELVYEKLLAANLVVDYAWRADPGLFSVYCELAPKVSPERALKTIDVELDKVATRGLAEVELVRAKGMLRSHVLREIASNNGRAHTLGTHEVLLGRWRSALELPERYAAVTAAQVKAAAGRLLERGSRSVVTLVPSMPEGGASDA